jgi:hypothetical protein
MSNDPTATAGATEPVSNMSIEELIARRTTQFSQPDEPEAEQSEEEEPDDPAGEMPDEIEDETQPDEDATEETDGEETTDIDLESLTPEQIQAIAKKGKSRLLQRFGELTAQKKALEEKLASQADAKPLPKSIPAEDNPFRDLSTMEQIHAKFEELEKVADDTDRILEDHEDYGSDDVITLGDREFTKKEIRTANRNARNAMAKFLPAQAQSIQRVAELTAMEQQFTAAIPLEIPEAADESTPIGAQYKAMREDPLIEQVRRSIPDLVPQLNYLLAHAARSLNLKKAVQKTAAMTPGTTPRPKVAGSPVGVGAAKSKAPAGKRDADEAYQRFEKTGSVEEWIAARAKKFQS